MGSAAATRADPQPRGGVNTTLNLEFIPVKFFSVAAELTTSALYTDPIDGPLDFLAAGGALRFSDAKRFGFELGATFPLVGSNRAMLALEMRGSARF